MLRIVRGKLEQESAIAISKAVLMSADPKSGRLGFHLHENGLTDKNTVILMERQV